MEICSLEFFRNLPSRIPGKAVHGAVSHLQNHLMWSQGKPPAAGCRWVPLGAAGCRWVPLHTVCTIGTEHWKSCKCCKSQKPLLQNPLGVGGGCSRGSRWLLGASCSHALQELGSGDAANTLQKLSAEESYNLCRSWSLGKLHVLQESVEHSRAKK